MNKAYTLNLFLIVFVMFSYDNGTVSSKLVTTDTKAHNFQKQKKK